VTPDGETLAIGSDPTRARVWFRSSGAIAALLRGDHLALAEAYLREEVDLEGDVRQALFVTDHLDLGPASRLRQALVWLRLVLDRRRLNRQSIAHHYDRPPEFFLAWLDPSRSYTHGMFATRDEDLATAQRRKLQFAIDALGLRAGMDVLDVGCGWGSFLEYAGAQGISVHGITLSRDQHAFVSAVARKQLRVRQAVDPDYRPTARSTAPCSGEPRHIGLSYVGRFLAASLEEAMRACGDCDQREGGLRARSCASTSFGVAVRGAGHYPTRGRGRLRRPRADGRYAELLPDGS
jgi:hypothetical protein